MIDWKKKQREEEKMETVEKGRETESQESKRERESEKQEGKER